MAFMKKDVNFAMMLLVVAIIIAFVSFTIFYHATFNDLTSNYTAKLEQLNKVTEDLQKQRSLLNQTSYELQIKSKREEEFNVQYTSIRDERDQLKSENEKLSAEIIRKTAELNQKTAELSATTAELANARSQISGLESEVSRLESRVNSLTSKLNKACDDLKTAGGTSTAC